MRASGDGVSPCDPMVTTLRPGALTDRQGRVLMAIAHFCKRKCREMAPDGRKGSAAPTLGLWGDLGSTTPAEANLEGPASTPRVIASLRQRRLPSPPRTRAPPHGTRLSGGM